MGKLKVLPAGLANMIAAGEVVQRPASVVKELMENAVDAGATQVAVIISDAGRTLIQVIDNGCGMSASDAVLCFERHATSKIATAEDLSAITSFGFRGEALASIAAVAEVTLRTRREGDETGTQVTVSGGSEIKAASVAAPAGSNFAIRNLFFNIPARRKFLKSDNAEFKHIIEEFTRVALTRPETGFILSHNGKDIFVLKKAKSLKFRILDLLGSNVTGDIVDVHADTSVIRVSGFVGRPDTSRKTLGNQYFFINGRYFRSPYLHKAVMKAYEDMIPDGLTPSYFLYLEADPHDVDVNVHPTKTEVKFENESIIFEVIRASVKETLGRHSFGSSIDFDTEGAVPLPQFGRSFDEYRGDGLNPSAEFDPDYNPFDIAPQPGPGLPAGADGEAAGQFQPAAAGMQPWQAAGMHPGQAGAASGREAGAGHPSASWDVSGYGRREDCSSLFEQKQMQQQSQMLVLQDKYIVTKVRSGLMVVNIRRAYERILFERMMKALAQEKHVSQTALFPVTVQVGAQALELFAEHGEFLRSLGFQISPSGMDSIEVHGVPEGYSCEEGKVRQMVGDLVLLLPECHSTLPELMYQNMAEKFATLGSFHTDNLTSPAEAQRLIDTLFACDNAEYTPAGRRIVNIIPAGDIEKLFD